MVRGTAEISYTVLYDVPLALVLRRHSVSVMSHAADGLPWRHQRVRASRADIERDVPKLNGMSSGALSEEVEGGWRVTGVSYLFMLARVHTRPAGKALLATWVTPPGLPGWGCNRAVGSPACCAANSALSSRKGPLRPCSTDGARVCAHMQTLVTFTTLGFLRTRTF